MSIHLRKATIDDAKAVAVILKTSRQSAMPYLQHSHTPEEDYAFIKDIVMQECRVVVAEEDNDILGFVAFNDDWIDHLYLLPEAQGKGVGSLLLNEELKKSDDYQLWVFQRNIAARAFYEAKGFKVIRETDGQDNDEKEPDVLYRWKRTI